MPYAHQKFSKDRQYHLLLFHLKVTVADFGAMTIPMNTLTSVASDPKEVFKCHGG